MAHKSGEYPNKDRGKIMIFLIFWKCIFSFLLPFPRSVASEPLVALPSLLQDSPTTPESAGPIVCLLPSGALAQHSPPSCALLQQHALPLEPPGCVAESGAAPPHHAPLAHVSPAAGPDRHHAAHSQLVLPRAVPKPLSAPRRGHRDPTTHKI